MKKYLLGLVLFLSISVCGCSNRGNELQIGEDASIIEDSIDHKEDMQDGDVVAEDMMPNASEPDDSQIEFSGASSTVLTYEKEGKQEEKTASLYVGEGYSLYVIDEDWNLHGPGWWIAENDQQIRFFISSYEGLNESQVERILTGYGFMEEDGGMWKQESDTVCRVRCYETESDVWRLEAVYPTEAEALWREEIWAMFDTFEVEEGYSVGDHTPKADMPAGEHLKLYEETYTDTASRAWGVHEPEYTGSYIYDQLTISNVTDDSFYFIVTRRNFETDETEVIIPLSTACFNEDGISAAYTGEDYTLTFDFSDYYNPLPVVLTIKLWGVEDLEGIQFYSSNIPGYESD